MEDLSTRAAFLLMPTALDWLATAQDCFSDDYGSLRQGLLTRLFSLVIGLERIFHLDEMEVTMPVAWPCGSCCCPGRAMHRRRLAASRVWYEVDALCRRTLFRGLHRHTDAALVRLPTSNTFPRWT